MSERASGLDPATGRPARRRWRGVIRRRVAGGRAEPSQVVFDVVFSPFGPVQANNVRNPNSPFALGDELVAHDQLFSHGQLAGDDAFRCVIVSVPPAPVPANCTGVFRLAGGTIPFQTTAVPGPTRSSSRVTGGTGTYNNAGGDGTLVEFGNGKGKLTLRLLSLVSRGGGA